MSTPDDRCPRCDGIGNVRWPLEDGGSPWMRCPECGGTGKAAIPQTGLAVDVPPGTPLHELARLAADAPEVRRETVTAAPPTLHVDTGTVTAWAAGRPAVQLPEAEAARRLLAFDALLAACEAAEASLDPYHAGQRHLREEIAGLLARLAKP